MIHRCITVQDSDAAIDEAPALLSLRDRLIAVTPVCGTSMLCLWIASVPVLDAPMRDLFKGGGR